MQKINLTDTDSEIRSCIDNKNNFAVIAGAGSGKTTSLIRALDYLQEKESSKFIRDDQKIVCITYTNRAVDVISQRLNWNEVFWVSTLHKFLWDNIQQFTSNIREVLGKSLIPEQIEKQKKKDNGKQTKTAIKARKRIALLQSDLANLGNVSSFVYTDVNYSNYQKGELGHDDIIAIASRIISENSVFREILGQKYPFIFVDEAQDTFNEVVIALNKICEGQGLPVVGYFGDPMQQIYDKRAGNFAVHEELKVIRKEENYRSSVEVINFLNTFRTDIKQFPAGENSYVNGSVLIRLVQAEEPQKGRKYTEEQLIRTSDQFDEAIKSWGWQDNKDAKHLFLVRQMIARRLGFPELQELFTGDFASQKANQDYEQGEHFLLKPFLRTLFPLVQASRDENTGRLLDVLRNTSPAFDPSGVNSAKTLEEMINLSKEIVQKLVSLWDTETLGGILRFAQNNNLCQISDRLSAHLDRQPRNEEYDEEIHSEEKSDWLVDSFLQRDTVEIEVYAKFIDESTPFSTQHGVKGEEYPDVIVIFDDVEASWDHYKFTKTLTPNTSGEPTEGQYERSTKLAYVCFSRAKENLRILLFTPNPFEAKQELLDNGLFNEEQIEVVMNK